MLFFPLIFIALSFCLKQDDDNGEVASGSPLPGVKVIMICTVMFITLEQRSLFNVFLQYLSPYISWTASATGWIYKDSEGDNWYSKGPSIRFWYFFCDKPGAIWGGYITSMAFCFSFALLICETFCE